LRWRAISKALAFESRRGDIATDVTWPGSGRLCSAAVLLSAFAMLSCAQQPGAALPSSPLPTVTTVTAQTSSPVPTAVVAPAAGSPSPTGPATPIPTLALPTGITGGRHGLITRRGERLVVRLEAEAAALLVLPQSVVAHRLGRIAYWKDANGTAELHVVEVPGTDRVVASFRERRGAGIAWAADGSGLVVSLAEPGARSGIARSLHTIELARGTTAEVYRATGPSGASVMPLVWRPDLGLIAAYETGPGGFHFGYTVIRQGSPPIRTDPSGRVIGMQASPDGSLVVATWIDDGAIQVWRTDDFAQRTELRIQGADLSQPQWSPGGDVAYAILTSGTSARAPRVEKWAPLSGARSTLTEFGQGAPASFFLRADGSGLVSQLANGAWQVTDLASSRSMVLQLEPGETVLATILVGQ
jgi:hypothetical protein